MEEKTKKILSELSAKSGLPLTDLEADFIEQVKAFTIQIPGKDAAYYEDLARRKVFLNAKADLVSPAKPYDFYVIDYGSKVDGNAGEMTEKADLWSNENTRAQAVAEGKVYMAPTGLPRMQMDVGGKKVDVPDGTPMDTDVWMVKPNAEKGIKGRKNARFGKPLQPSFFRNIVGFGRPAKGGKLKLLSIMASNEQADNLPPKRSIVRARLNLKEDRENIYMCNTGRRTKYEPSSIAEIEPMTEAKLVQIFETAPEAIHPSLANLRAWHDLHDKDGRRLVIFSGDVTRVNREPTAYGSYLVVIEDTSALDLEAEGTPVWASEEPNFGVGSKVYGIARTGIGPGFNRESGQLDATIERIQLNPVALVADPQFRVPPEEESVIEGEKVK